MDENRLQLIEQALIRTRQLSLFDRDQRIEITYPGMVKEIVPGIVRFLRPSPGKSFVLYTHVDPEDANELIRQQIAYFSAQDLNFDWKVYAHDLPEDLAQRLSGHGFKLDAEDVVMLMDLDDPPAPLLEPPRVELRRLEYADQLADVITVLEKVWHSDFSWVYSRLGSHMDIPGYVEVYCAYLDHKPASTGWVYFSPGSQIASLWGGSTVSGARGRGLYSAILAARVQAALQRGLRYMTVDASPMSYPILSRRGFFQITTTVSAEWIVPK